MTATEEPDDKKWLIITGVGCLVLIVLGLGLVVGVTLYAQSSSPSGPSSPGRQAGRRSGGWSLFNNTQSMIGAAAGDIGAFNSALALYQVDVNSQTFPAYSLHQLYNDNAPGWSGPYMATISDDPWGNAYMYTSSGSDYTIQSVHQAPNRRAETIRYCFGTGMMESIP